MGNNIMLPRSILLIHPSRLPARCRPLPSKASTAPPLRIFGRASSSAASSRGGATGTPPSPGYQALSATIKYLRIPALIAGVGTLGYQMGCMDTLADPSKKEKTILESICRSAGCSDPKDSSNTRMISDGELRNRNHNALMLGHHDLAHRDPQLHRVATVGRAIVHVARNLANKERKDDLERIKSNLPPDIDPPKIDQIANIDELIENPIAAAASSMEGEWTYILLNSPAPNAFVTSLLPRKIFVTTAMMDKLIDNDDEMALVLGHETSHLLLGHVKKRTMAEAILTTLEILILMNISAFGGVATIQSMTLLSSIKRWISNAYSRESESEADAMGIKLAAMACYDTKRGIKVFDKMAKMDPPGVSFLTIELDHPPTEERYKVLLEMSDLEDKAKYENGTCKELKRYLRNIHML